MKVFIDPQAGFCPGVKKAIQMAETGLNSDHSILALGELIHNHEENSRLEKLGLQVIDHSFLEDETSGDSGKNILIRAHGEPPADL